MDRKAILDKVVKLLALAENNIYDAEAETAKNMAAELMAKYDIAIMELKVKPEFVEDVRDLTRRKLTKHDRMLFNEISIFNGVAMLTQDTWEGIGKTIFYGRLADIQCNDYIIDAVLSQRVTAWKQHLAEYKEVNGFRPKSSKKHAWMRGFAFGVREKLNSLNTLKNAKITEKGLVPVSVYGQALTDYKTKHKTSSQKSSKFTFNPDGYDAGKGVCINKGVEKQTDVRQLS